MDKRITDLTQIQFSAITANDVLPIVNISTDDTNKITIDQIKNYVNSGVTDTYVTGGTYFTGGTIIFDYNTGSNFEVSGLTEDLNNEIAGLAETDEQTITLNLDTNKIELKEIVAETTGGTRTFQGNFAISGGTLNLTTIGSGSPVINLGLDSSGEVVTGTTSFTGNTSGECISDIYVSNVHSCSPLHINPNDEGNVYFGSTSGVTVDLTNHKLVVENLQITSGATDGYILTSDASGNIELTAPTDGFTYQIGQYVEEEGGVIFHSYKDGTNENYLVVSIDDQAGSGLDCDTISVTYQLVGEEPVTVEVETNGIVNGKNNFFFSTPEGGIDSAIRWDFSSNNKWTFIRADPDAPFGASVQATLSEDTPCPFGVFTIEEGSIFEAFEVAPSGVTNKFLFPLITNTTNKTIRWTDLYNGTTETEVLTANKLYSINGAKYANGTKVEFLNNSSGVVNTWTFLPKCECTYEPIKVQYLNTYGALITTWFYKANKKEFSMENSEFKRFQTVDSNFYVGKQRQTFNTSAREKITVNSDWVLESYSQVIKDIITSEYTLVNDQFANVETKSIEIHQNINNALINYQLTFTYSNDYRR